MIEILSSLPALRTAVVLCCATLSLRGCSGELPKPCFESQPSSSCKCASAHTGWRVWWIRAEQVQLFLFTIHGKDGFRGKWTALHHIRLHDSTQRGTTRQILRIQILTAQSRPNPRARMCGLHAKGIFLPMVPIRPMTPILPLVGWQSLMLKHLSHHLNRRASGGFVPIRRAWCRACGRDQEPSQSPSPPPRRALRPAGRLVTRTRWLVITTTSHTPPFHYTAGRNASFGYPTRGYPSSY